MDLADVLNALLRRWLVLLLVTVPLVAGTAWYAQSLPSTYESTAVLAFQPRPGAQIGADVVRLVLPQYTAILGAPGTAERLAEDFDVEPRSIETSLTVSIPPETSTIEVTVEDTDPRHAALLANAVARLALEAALGDALLEAERVVTAIPAREAAGPPRRLLVAAGALVAVVAGIAAALTLERLQPGARTMAEVEAALGLPVLGTLPAAPPARQIADLMGDTAFGGAVRLLRTNLGQLERSDGVRVVGVASLRGGQDPATVACAFASSLAAVNARVLLVDGDLARPRIAGRLGLDPGPGLSTVLRGEVGMQEAVTASGIEGLDVLAGRADADATDHVAVAFPALRREAEAAYDFVVVAAPDLLGSGVTPLLTALVDGVLLVVERGASVHTLREALRVLALVNARTLGAVTVS